MMFLVFLLCRSQLFLFQTRVSISNYQLGILLNRHGLPFRLIRVRTPTRGTQSVEVVSNVVPAEGTYLVSTGTWLEVAVLYIKFLHAERTRIVPIVAIKDSIRFHLKMRICGNAGLSDKANEVDEGIPQRLQITL